jgi:hypothetical protein
LYVLQKVQAASKARPVYYLMGTVGFFPEVKLKGCEAERSLPSSAVVKNEWSYNSTSPLCLQGVEWDSSIFSSLLFENQFECGTWFIYFIMSDI